MCRYSSCRYTVIRILRDRDEPGVLTLRYTALCFENETNLVLNEDVARCSATDWVEWLHGDEA